MKKIFFTSVLSLIGYGGMAQNVGIGISDPINKLHVLGNLLVNAPYTSTNTPPTVAQTQTLSNGGNVYFFENDSTGRLYDTGGPAADYINNLAAYCTILNHNTSRGYEMVLEDVDLGAGDSLIIHNGQNYLLAVGNGYSTPGKWIINSSLLYLTFKSNGDGINGRGFILLFRRLYDLTGSQQPLTGYVGKGLFFDTKKGSFRAGILNAVAVGDYSTALGNSASASGQSSTAIGAFTAASGQSSFAGGQATLASGFSSVAMGNNSQASGDYSLAFGSTAKAQANSSIALGTNSTAAGFTSTAMGFAKAMGNYSTAIGYGPVANGPYSTAIGLDANANGESSFAIGNLVYVGGTNAIGIGNNLSVGGSYALALGNNNIAGGSNSTTIGNGSTASGAYSTTLGNYVSTSNFNGAFAIGDNSTTTVMQSFVANGFRARFAGGYRLLSNSAATVGVVLLPDGNSWGAVSDVKLKENFIPVDGESFLKKISAIPLTTWNYKGQDAKLLRHYGPMAQDFYNAFGRDDLGEIGCDSIINQQDFLGVNFIGVQALEKRTTRLQNQLDISMELIKSGQQQVSMLIKANQKLEEQIMDLRRMIKNKK